MSMTKKSGFVGPVPPSIKLDGFYCYRRGGCDRQALCEGERECLGVDPRLAKWFSRNGFDEIAEITCHDIPPPANALRRNRFDEIAEIVCTLTYTEMTEFAGALWRLRGNEKINGETLPKILHAWAREMELPSDCAVRDEPALPAGEHDCGAGKKFQPIDTAPKDRPILAFMLGQWRIARWKRNHPHKRPIPFWSADDLRVTVSRAHQPKWWAELPASPPEAGA
jgi:hypothetical protein